MSRIQNIFQQKSRVSIYYTSPSILSILNHTRYSRCWSSSSTTVSSSSSSSSSLSSGNKVEDGYENNIQRVYHGPFGSMLGTLKRVSVFSCVCTLVSVPILAFVGTPELTIVQRSIVAGTVSAFAILTTYSLHTVLKPYVLDIYLLPSSSNENHEQKQQNLEGNFKDNKSRKEIQKAVPIGGNEGPQIRIDTLSLFGRKISTDLNFNELLPTKDRAWANFRTRSGTKNTDKHYYVHDEGEEAVAGDAQEEDTNSEKNVGINSGWLDETFREEFFKKILRKKAQR
jgi:hypothetical protein